MSNSSRYYRFSGSAGRVTVTETDEYGGETEIGTVRTHGRRLSSAAILDRLGINADAAAEGADSASEGQSESWGVPHG